MRDDAYSPIATIPKHSHEDLGIAIGEYRGSTFVNVRVFTDIGDDRRPTKAGVTIRPDRIADVSEALGKAQTEALRCGLV